MTCEQKIFFRILKRTCDTTEGYCVLGAKTNFYTRKWGKFLSYWSAFSMLFAQRRSCNSCK